MSKKTESKKVNFTAKRISEFACPKDKNIAFLWDASTNGLGLRATENGKPSYVFQGRYQNKTIRMTIGSPENWSIPKAQEKARELQSTIDGGRDPREVKAEAVAADAASRAERRVVGITVGEVWKYYINTRQNGWSKHHYNDHLKMTREAGKVRENRPGVKTIAGPLTPLMPCLLSDINNELLEKWAKKEAKQRPSQSRLAVRLFKAFLRWTSRQENQKYSGCIVDSEAASGEGLARILGKGGVKEASLLREQAPAWFRYVRQLPNPVIAAYLQCLLLTGARREEMATLKWVNVDFQWGSLSISDKVSESRQIPLTPYVSHLITDLPRSNEWVFSSPASKSGRLIEPRAAHKKVCDAAGLELTLHDLRRSFKNLSDWHDPPVPVGVVAQIMGHAPSATAEKHYTKRSLDLLRRYHEQIEGLILEFGEVTFEPVEPPCNVIAGDFKKQ